MVMLPAILETFAHCEDVMKIKSSTLLLAPLFAISAAAQTPSHFDGQTWWDYIKVLADDKMEGRETGSRG